MQKLDCVVIGAGVIGLSIARSFAQAGREVVVLESEDAVGSHSSARNSEVIHAGIYYRENTLKAKLCVAGKEMLYRYCEEHGVPHCRIGKMIVATSSDEHLALRGYRKQARANGVDDVDWMSADEILNREPFVVCESALWSGSTGIIDSHAYMTSLQADIESAGGFIVCRSKVKCIDVDGGQIFISIGHESDTSIQCNILINAAGLWAQELAAKTSGMPADNVPNLYYSKAHYYTYQGRCPLQGLVYPVPSDSGLGIHATVDLSGQVRFGPDARWVDSVNYDFDDTHRAKFVNAIEKYFPSLNPDKLQPAYTGIRPKLAGPGVPAADFIIQATEDHGVEGLCQLFGIESPGLTASLAIGEHVKNKMLAA